MDHPEPGRDTRPEQAPAEDGSTQPDVSDYEKTIAVLRGRVGELEDQLLRALADLDNVRKRAARQMEQARAEERAGVAGRWLVILDHLDLALQHAGADPDSIVAGVRSTRDQAVEILGELGFPRHGEVGVRFDPARHEAVAAVPAQPDSPPGTVVDVLRPGYGDDGHQLRPAAVVVSRETDDRA